MVRIGPSLFGILLVVVSAAALPGHGSLSGSDIAVVAFVALAGIVSWAVTRWRVDGDTLRVETGLIRRQSLQVPLSRAQAVDLVEPFLARVLGLAEVRVRTGGASRGDARLCYLRYDEATVCEPRCSQLPTGCTRPCRRHRSSAWRSSRTAG